MATSKLVAYILTHVCDLILHAICIESRHTEGKPQQLHSKTT